MSKYALLKAAIDIPPEEASFPVFAQAVHRTHKNKRIKIKGSYLQRIYEDKSRMMVIRKATQSGISEYMIARTIYKAFQGKSILYVLPTYDLKNLFVRDRVDRSLQHSVYYSQMINEQSSRLSESASLKHLGKGTITFVGSNTANAFISFPADDVYIDELDNCNQDNILMAEERQSASTDKYTIKVGNPTIHGVGIDYEFSKTDQKEWYIRAECGHIIKPDFFKHVVEEVEHKGQKLWRIRDREWEEGTDRDIYPICDKCGKGFDRFGVGEWVASSVGHSGYYISKMFSTTVTIREMVDKFSESLNNETLMQRFYNGDLGLAYSSSGTGITDQMLMDCEGIYGLPVVENNTSVCGIDVGAGVNSIVIADVLDDKVRVIYVGELESFDDLYLLLVQYKVKCFVIDSAPETRESMKLVRKAAMGPIRAYGALCHYTVNKKDLQLIAKFNTLSIDRTISLDSVRESILTQKILLPRGSQNIPSFYEHMKASTRVYNEKSDRFDWLHGTQPDHYFHAMNYMLLARRILSIARYE